MSLLDYLKAAAGEASLHTKLGQWRQKVSAALDASGSAGAADDVWNCPASVQVNGAVYVSGADTVDQADATAGSTKVPVIGFVTSKPTPTTAVVQYSGVLPNVFVGLVPGTIYYLSETPGGIMPAGTLVPPGTWNQQVGVAKSATTLLAAILEAV